VSKGDLREHLVNLLNSLTNLSPSRSIISQIILITSEKQTTLHYSFPELNVPEFKELLKVMGMVFENEVKLAKGSFAEALTELIHKTFDWLDDELIYFDWSTYFGGNVMRKMDEVRSSLAKLTGLRIDLIPNPYLEWAKLVIAKLCHVYGKEKVIRFVKGLLDGLPLSRQDYPPSIIEEIGAKVGTRPAELKEICELIACLEKKAEHVGTMGSGRHPMGDVWIEHSKYHLDPLLLTQVSGKYTYGVRHRESLRKALEEVV